MEWFDQPDDELRYSKIMQEKNIMEGDLKCYKRERQRGY